MITIDAHHNGPAGSGHGGVSGGLFAELVDAHAATVRFHRPIPLETDLSHAPEPQGVSVLAGETHIATVRALPEPLRVGPFPSLDDTVVAEAERRWLDAREGRHVAPTCFACGDDRSHGTLGLRPGPVGSTGLFATRWHPVGSGPLPAWMVWAALDCPTGCPAVHAVGSDEGVVTGELSVEIFGPVTAGRPYRLLSRRVGGGGRRHLTEAALLGPDGNPLAVASATWITVPLAVLAGVG